MLYLLEPSVLLLLCSILLIGGPRRGRGARVERDTYLRVENSSIIVPTVNHSLSSACMVLTGFSTHKDI